MKINKPAAAFALSAAMMFSVAPLASAQDPHDHDGPHPAQEQHGGPQGHDHQADPHGAQPDHGQPHGFVRHDDWKQGGHMGMNDWNRGQKIDYRAMHLNKPPKGHEWREIDGNYVLAAIASGTIVSVVVAPR